MVIFFAAVTGAEFLHLFKVSVIVKQNIFDWHKKIIKSTNDWVCTLYIFMKLFHKIIKLEYSEGVTSNMRQTTIKTHFFTPTKKVSQTLHS